MERPDNAGMTLSTVRPRSTAVATTSERFTAEMSQGGAKLPNLCGTAFDQQHGEQS